MEYENKKVLLDLITGPEFDDAGVLRSWEHLMRNEKLWANLEKFKEQIQADINDKDLYNTKFNAQQETLFAAHLDMLEQNLNLWMEKIKSAKTLLNQARKKK